MGGGVAVGPSPREGPQEEEQIWVEEMMTCVEFVVLMRHPGGGVY